MNNFLTTRSRKNLKSIGWELGVCGDYTCTNLYIELFKKFLTSQKHTLD